MSASIARADDALDRRARGSTSSFPGSEAKKRRAAVIVSNDAANATAARLGRGVITVVPVTSNVARIYPFQVLLPAAETGLDRDSRAQAEQVRSIAVERLVPGWASFQIRSCWISMRPCACIWACNPMTVFGYSAGETRAQRPAHLEAIER